MEEELISDENSVKIWLGNEIRDGRGNLEGWGDKINWVPEEEQNQHMLISGGSGSGKTETLKVICSELKSQKVPLLIFDFHNDFGEFAGYIVNEENSKIHPLQILPGEKPKDVAYKVSSILKNSFKELTVIQEGVIRKAIFKFYRDSGIDDLNIKLNKSPQLLPFYKFKKCFSEVCSEQRTVNSLEIKLDILFDYELFSDRKSVV